MRVVGGMEEETEDCLLLAGLSRGGGYEEAAGEVGGGGIGDGTSGLSFVSGSRAGQETEEGGREAVGGEGDGGGGGIGGM